MTQHLGLVSIVVRDYDEAIDFYVNQLGFRLVEDSPLPEPGKRWVVVAPDGSGCGREPVVEPYGTVAVFSDTRPFTQIRTQKSHKTDPA